MFESIKNQLWDVLKKKDVSLVMIFDRDGQILWHKGREIIGKSIHMGSGFSRSFAKKIIANGNRVNAQDLTLMVFGDQLSQSAKNLDIKSLIILPIKSDFFLYVDSGSRQYFTEADLEVFNVLGELLEKTIHRVESQENSFSGFPGDSPGMKNTREMLLKFSLEDEPVLLLGETGVGKSHYAERIHRYSGREGKFVVAEVTSINESLFESTMFGHKKGAFTDAKTDKAGLVNEAQKGTLFIDEVSEIPLSFQAKLLRFIETKKYRILGDNTELTADVRIVAASNRNLQQAIAEKEFREDLYYRLHVLEVLIPPLRHRKEDIRAFIHQNRHYLKNKELGDGFWEEINRYDWPGNMRELITVLKRAGILLDAPVSGEKLRRVIYSKYEKAFQHPAVDDIDGSWKETIHARLAQGETFWEVVKQPFLDRELNRGQVKAILAEALSETRGNYKETLGTFNLSAEDYERFMKFLYRNRLN